MKRFAIGALCALVLACASSPPDVLAHPDGIASVTPGEVDTGSLFLESVRAVLTGPGDAIGVVIAKVAIVAPTDSEVRTGDTGEPSPDNGHPARLPFDVIAEPPSPHATLRDTLIRLHRSDTATANTAKSDTVKSDRTASTRVLRIDRDPSRIGGAIKWPHPARG